jgi:hypothetical protein
LGASGFLFGRHGSSVNHQASDLSQPVPLPVPACGLQPVEPGWQPMRMWKWESWPQKGRILFSQPRSPVTVSQSFFLIPGWTRIRSTSG